MADDEKAVEAAEEQEAAPALVEAVEAPLDVVEAAVEVVEPAAPEEPAGAEPQALPAYVVQEGRTVQHNGVVYGDGEPVPFSADDLAAGVHVDLMDRGVIA